MVIKIDYLEHHGIKGQKWGIRRTPEQLGHASAKRRAAQSKANLIFSETKKYSNGGPSGNQNCQLCTWSMECQLRGKDVTPRPVYSPRDVAFTMNGYDIVKNPVKTRFKSQDDVVSQIKQAGDGSRFYTHVNWKGSTGGHEFITTNIGGDVYVLDGQVGLLAKVGSKKAQSYFGDINFKKSFLVRMDDKELNEDILKYNDKKYTTKWDWKADIDYMKKNGMIGEEEAKRARLEHSIPSESKQLIVDGFSSFARTYNFIHSFLSKTRYLKQFK